MAFTEHELARIDKLVGGLCNRLTRPDLKAQLRFEYRVKGHDVTLLEIRPNWDGAPGETEHGVAKLKFVRKAGEWRLFWLRADLKWHSYKPRPSSRDFGELVGEVASDPHACFFG